MQAKDSLLWLYAYVTPWSSVNLLIKYLKSRMWNSFDDLDYIEFIRIPKASETRLYTLWLEKKDIQNIPGIWIVRDYTQVYGFFSISVHLPKNVLFHI